jgi:hypothetical protein
MFNLIFFAMTKNIKLLWIAKLLIRRRWRGKLLRYFSRLPRIAWGLPFTIFRKTKTAENIRGFCFDY